MPISIAVRFALRSQRRSRRRSRSVGGDDDQVQRRYEEIANRAEEIAIRRLRQAAQRMVNIAKSVCPVVSGRLQQSIRITRQTSHYSRVEATVEYAKYVEFGTSRFEGRFFMRQAYRRARNLLAGTLKVSYQGESVTIRWREIIEIRYSRIQEADPRIDLILNPAAIDRAVNRIADTAVTDVIQRAIDNLNRRT